LDNRAHFEQWQYIFFEHYHQLIEDVQRRRKIVMDDYGATNPTEFFALGSESFFEESIKLRDEHPELYGVLMRYYKQDTAKLWEDAST